MSEAPRPTKTTRIVEEGSLHKYRTEIPNTVIRGVKSRDLSVYAKWLYVYLKSVAGEDSVCFRSTTTIALESGMSRGQASEAKKELVSKGLITIKKGKNPRRDADHIRIKDLWLANMQEFCVHNTNTVNDNEDALSQQVSEPSVHNMNSDDRQCSQYELSVHNMNSVFTIRTKEDPIKKEPIKKEEDSLTTFESLSGTGNAVSLPDATPALPRDRSSQAKKKKAITPLDPHDWLWQELQHYQEEFDIDALNDDTWWSNVANSFPTFTREWVILAFASLARWQADNPSKRARSQRGWKTRMNYSLNWYYDKHMRRQGYGQAKRFQGSRY